MEIKFKDDELDDTSETLDKVLETDSELKELLVNYVGEKKKPENDEVTVEMVVETISEEFPDFLLAVAEENFVRGYQQALTDVEIGETIYQEELSKRKNDD